MHGLQRHPDPDELLRGIAQAMQDGEQPQEGESIWGWYARQTGEWYGSDADVRFGDGSPEAGRAIRYGEAMRTKPRDVRVGRVEPLSQAEYDHEADRFERGEVKL